jgi:hypothetical protein
MPEGSVFRDGRGAASRASIVFANNDFLSCGERRMPVWVTTLSNDNARFTSAERRVGVIILAMIALWLSEPLHGIHSSLCGERGVARVFGPQKGATPEQVAMLEQGLEHYASVIQRDIGLDVRLSPGSGASGGLGAGLHALLGATLHNRYAIVMQYLDLDRQLASADLVITAEGTIDGQTPYGKIPAAMTRRDQRYGIPVVYWRAQLAPTRMRTINTGSRLSRALCEARAQSKMRSAMPMRLPQHAQRGSCT